MVTGRFVTDKEKVDLAGRLRAEIFQGAYVTDVFPYPDARYAVLWVDDVPAGMGGVRYIGQRFTVIELGILEDYRMQRYGDLLLRLMADRAVDDGLKKIYAEATEASREFFAAAHFVPDDEPPCGSMGQERTPMVLELKELRCACSRDRFNPYLF